MTRHVLFLGLCLLAGKLQAQYAPQATLPGSTAIHHSSSSIAGWAKSCVVVRGYQDIQQPSLGFVSSGDSSLVVGPADGQIVSLGDAGTAVCTFHQTIKDGAGFDFVVFENGFGNPANVEEAFLELAKVSVSSDGVNFFEFPTHSLTQTNAQVPGAGVYMNASKLNNLAGKYKAQYGTPFDLADLAPSLLLDKNHITHVKIMDVVGVLKNIYSSKDTAGNDINDPYPSAFPTGGFDLDAIGVLHANSTSLSSIDKEDMLAIYPNPVQNELQVTVKKEGLLKVYNSQGSLVLLRENFRGGTLDFTNYSAGVYQLQYQNQQQTWHTRFVKH